MKKFFQIFDLFFDFLSIFCIPDTLPVAGQLGDDGVRMYIDLIFYDIFRRSERIVRDETQTIGVIDQRISRYPVVRR